MQKGGLAKIVTIAYYAILSILLILCFFDLVGDLLPVGAKQVSRNSEAYAAALVLTFWLQFARPRLHGSRWQWPITGAAALGCLGIALLFFFADSWTTRVTTLNESFFALAVVIPYLQSERRRPALGPALSGAVLALIVFGERTALVTDFAETLALVLLVPVAFDLIDRGVLTPGARTSAVVRYGWYVLLIVAPSVFRVLHYDIGFDGLAGTVTQYSVRLTEAFATLLIAQVFLAVVLPRLRRRPAAAEPPRPEAAVAAG